MESRHEIRYLNRGLENAEPCEASSEIVRMQTDKKTYNGVQEPETRGR